MKIKRSIKNCNQCGTVFEAIGKSVMFCSDECKFWSYVDKRGPNDCWLWKGAKIIPRGYGQFVLSGGTHICASRYSWKVAHGEIPDDVLVLHNCPNGDNPSCVNPKHLWTGTQKQNVDDMDAKGRRNPAFGERNYRAIVTEHIVRAIRSVHAESGLSYPKLATMFGLKENHVSKILRRIIWKHVS